MPDQLKERIRRALPDEQPAPDLDAVARRARRLRARRVAASALAGVLIVAAVVVPLAALRHLHAPSTAASTRHLQGAGMSVDVPPGWHARIVDLPGLGGTSLQASTVPLPRTTAPNWPVGVPHGVRVGVVEVTGLCPCRGFRHVETIGGFRSTDWYRPVPIGSNRETRVFQKEGGYLKLVTVGNGRAFVVWASFRWRPAPPHQLRQVDTLLSSIAIDPDPVAPSSGTSSPPVSFDPGDGGQTAWSAAAGEAPTAWAWTVPLDTRDVIGAGLSSAFDYYPISTVDHLARGGVVVVATILPKVAGTPMGAWPARLGDAVPQAHWEGGEEQRIARYRVDVPVGRAQVAQVDVYFPTHRPTPRERLLARSILDRLKVPWVTSAPSG